MFCLFAVHLEKIVVVTIEFETLDQIPFRNGKTTVCLEGSFYRQLLYTERRKIFSGFWRSDILPRPRILAWYVALMVPRYISRMNEVRPSLKPPIPKMDDRADTKEGLHFFFFLKGLH